MRYKFKMILCSGILFLSLGSWGETLNFNIEIPMELSKALHEEELGFKQWNQKAQKIKIELSNQELKVIDIQTIRCKKIYK